MKYNILTENSYLYQGMTLFEQHQLQKWERLSIDLKEAQLTADQIQQLFQQIEQGATATGSNRTVLGKGKDVATAVNQAWGDLKKTIYNSGPMEGFAAKYDSAVKKLKQATGGDEGAMKYVQKYRQFAEKHPILQGAVYAALIAAAGVSGAGLGGAAALGLFKLTDQLLQGKDVRSALYQGAKTGAIAYGASKLGDLIRGGGAETAGTGTGTGDAAAGSATPEVNPDSQAKIDNLTAKYPPGQYTYQDAGAGNINILDADGQMVANADIKSTGLTGQQFVDKADPGTQNPSTGAAGGAPATAQGSSVEVGEKLPDGSVVKSIDSSNAGFGVTVEKPDGSTVPMGRQEIQDIKGQSGAANQPVGGVTGAAASDPTAGTGIVKDVQTTTTPDGGTTTTGTMQGITQDQIQNHPAYKAEIEKWGNNPEARRAAAMKARAAILKGESKMITGKKLSEGRCYYLFKLITETNNRMISEGKIWELGRKPLKEQEQSAWQKIKSKAADVGKNLTTKVTASKLTSAWKKAQSPSDSDQVAEFLKTQGVNDQVIAQVYSEMQLPAPGKGAAAKEIQDLKTQLAKLGPKTRQGLIDMLQQQLGTA